ncbi:hypothetical protein SDC9_92207 [bioreactor metagenome]|uniref:Uncharacterized protein n=1 Tax=bioreactor metagenome TaxID=1076179 RepID=A0A644ZX11_9ZZZZ
MANPMGATMSTVATLSTKALMTPANRAKAVTASWMLGTLVMRISAKRKGILLSMNKVTMPIVPPIINNTL